MPYPDYYALLGVPRFYASQEEIRKAYIEQVRFFHPDAGNVAPDIAKSKTQELNNAYAVLSDPAKKRDYDGVLDLYIQSTQLKQDSNTAQKPGANSSEQAKTERPSRETSSTQSRSKAYRNSWIMLFTGIFVAGICVYMAIHSSPSNPVPSTLGPNSSVSEAEPDYSPLPSPRTGRIFSMIAHDDAVGPLEIVTRGENNYLVKLRDYYTGNEVMSFYVRGGETANVEVPVGAYELSYACGPTWYGIEHLFGEETRCAKADDIFSFEIDGEYVTGWTVELYLQADGNLSTEYMDIADF